MRITFVRVSFVCMLVLCGVSKGRGQTCGTGATCAGHIDTSKMGKPPSTRSNSPTTSTPSSSSRHCYECDSSTNDNTPSAAGGGIIAGSGGGASLSAGGGTVAGPGGGPFPSAVPWEYQMITATTANDLTTQANSLGARGWEIVSVVLDQSRTDKYVGYLKRRK